jgi:hypothetical protein
MEGTRIAVRIRRSQPPTLAVLQEFVGGRMERQWWSRAYELAAPTVGVVAGRIRLANSAEWSVRDEVMASTMAKGA